MILGITKSAHFLLMVLFCSCFTARAIGKLMLFFTKNYLGCLKIRLGCGYRGIHNIDLERLMYYSKKELYH